MLADLGCDVVQGFLLAQPMPADDFLTWLDQPVSPLRRHAGAV